MGLTPKGRTIIAKRRADGDSAAEIAKGLGFASARFTPSWHGATPGSSTATPSHSMTRPEDKRPIRRTSANGGIAANAAEKQKRKEVKMRDQL